MPSFDARIRPAAPFAVRTRNRHGLQEHVFAKIDEHLMPPSGQIHVPTKEVIDSFSGRLGHEYGDDLGAFMSARAGIDLATSPHHAVIDRPPSHAPKEGNP